VYNASVVFDWLLAQSLPEPTALLPLALLATAARRRGLPAD
jgi:hypothetical protein